MYFKAGILEHWDENTRYIIIAFLGFSVKCQGGKKKATNMHTVGLNRKPLCSRIR